ncbi:carboxypeptidase regulatory-like domain-containing protein, partial [Pseudenhygromyxa sp. WMMC2535]|uniref:carboxypeptidase-like regulatory domain-containing protein n=1 Tax=Pseudenhygromyxa sp. WMMC2535 TaxID=2712867 RepID=UPI001555C816
MEQGRRGSGWLVVLAALLLVSSAGLGLGWWRLGAREDGGQRGGGEHSRAERGRVRSDWGRRFGPRGARARVSGRILDPRGQGLAFAEVCAFAETYPLRGLDDGAPRCVRADASGRYHLEDLWPVETHIHASARGFIAQRRRDPEHPRARIGLDLAPGEQREDVDIRLRRGGVAIRGRVLDLAGAPLADALVWVLGPAHSTSAGVAVTRSDAQGGFELWAARGPRTVVAWAGGQVHGQREVLAPDEGVALVLAPASVLEGRVVDARDGAPVPGALVSPGGHFGSGYDVRSDAEGRFRISALEPGDYRPAAKTRDRHGHAETLVALGLGERVTELEIRVRPGVTVRGRVELVESGLPCTHGSLRLHSRAHGEYAELDPRGRVELIGVPPGRYAVALSCRDAIPRPRYPDLLVRDDHVGGLRWEVIEGLKIRGQVVDERGRGIPGVPLRLRARLGGSVAELASREDEYSDERGNFVFAGLEPGRYAIALGPSTHRPGPAEPVVVELGARDLDDLRVVLPAAASLRGRTTDAAGAAWPGVEVDVWSGRWTAAS